VDLGLHHRAHRLREVVQRDDAEREVAVVELEFREIVWASIWSPSRPKMRAIRSNGSWSTYFIVAHSIAKLLE
jgi:hypothetical protein